MLDGTEEFSGLAVEMAGHTTNAWPARDGTDWATREDVHPQLDFKGVDHGEWTGIEAERVYLRWSGVIEIPKSGKYAFYLAADDYGRLWIDDQLLVVRGTAAASLDANEGFAEIELVAGHHDLLVQCINWRGPAGIRLSWSSETIEKEVVPAAVLSQHQPEPAVAVSGENGRYRFPKLAPANYRLEALVPGEAVSSAVNEAVAVKAGEPVSDIDFQMPAIKKGQWRHFTSLDGLGHTGVSVVYEAADGAIWFGLEEGASRFDGAEFTTLSPADGFPAGRVTSISQDSEGRMWFGSGSGLARYDARSDACLVCFQPT